MVEVRIYWKVFFYNGQAKINKKIERRNIHTHFYDYLIS